MISAMNRLMHMLTGVFEVGPTAENSFGVATRPAVKVVDGEVKAVEAMRRGFQAVVGTPADEQSLTQR